MHLVLRSISSVDGCLRRLKVQRRIAPTRGVSSVKLQMDRACLCRTELKNKCLRAYESVDLDILTVAQGIQCNHLTSEFTCMIGNVACSTTMPRGILLDTIPAPLLKGPWKARNIDH